MCDEKVKAYWQGYNTAKSEVAIDIFEVIDKIIEKNKYKSFIPNSPFWSYEYREREIIKEIMELKKKYTKGAQDVQEN